jgi:creatinine amidohydrolase
VGAVSVNGVLGDPTGADAARGRSIFERWTRELVDAVERWRSSP